LTAVALRRLREGVFRLELQLVESMVAGDIDMAKVRALSHCSRALEVLDVLQVTSASGNAGVAAQIGPARPPRPTTQSQTTGDNPGVAAASGSWR
jgi:hypothetical protein